MYFTNSLTITGTAVAAPELRQTNSGKAVAELRIAHNIFKDGQQLRTDFFNVQLWNKTAENAARDIQTSAFVVVSGKLATQQYTNKDGNKVTKTFIVGESVGVLARAAKSATNAGSPDPTGNSSVTARAENFADFGEDIPDDELPY